MLRGFGYLLTRLCRPPVLAVEFRDGAPRARAGVVPPGLLADCRDIAEQFALGDGRVEVVRGGRGLELRFSPELPPASHQRFRNVFGVHLVGRR